MWRSVHSGLSLLSMASAATRARPTLMASLLSTGRISSRKGYAPGLAAPFAHTSLPIKRFLATEPHMVGVADYAASDEKPKEIERFPLPPGIPTDKLALFEIQDSSKDYRDVKGMNCVLSVHGPHEDWLPKGIEGHGACGGKFAVIATGGTQYKVMKGDVLYTNRQPGEVNSQVDFTDVLVIGTFDWSLFGRPLIRGAKVVATIEEQTRAGKIFVTKFKKRKGYRRRQGHRQTITRYRINEIVYDLPDASHVKEFEPELDATMTPMPNIIRNL